MMDDKFKIKGITGVILAGGQSRRFGRDKARVVVGPSRKPVLLDLFGLLESLGLKPVVVADEEDKYEDLGLKATKDLIAGQGPLGGIYTALKTVATGKVLVLTCDMPFVGMGLLRKLLLIGAQGDEGVVYGKEGELQPFPGVYAKKYLPKIEALLQQTRLGMRDFLMEQTQLRVVPFNLQTQDFFNMNTPEDLNFIGGFYDHARTD